MNTKNQLKMEASLLGLWAIGLTVLLTFGSYQAFNEAGWPPTIEILATIFAFIVLAASTATMASLAYTIRLKSIRSST